MSIFFRDFFFGVKDSILKTDALGQLYMDMYGHVDGCLREMVRF